MLLSFYPHSSSIIHNLHTHSHSSFIIIIKSSHHATTKTKSAAALPVSKGDGNNEITPEKKSIKIKSVFSFNVINAGSRTENSIKLLHMAHLSSHEQSDCSGVESCQLLIKPTRQLQSPNGLLSLD
jgi:hypothetical protein